MKNYLRTDVAIALAVAALLLATLLWKDAAKLSEERVKEEIVQKKEQSLQEAKKQELTAVHYEAQSLEVKMLTMTEGLYLCQKAAGLTEIPDPQTDPIALKIKAATDIAESRVRGARVGDLDAVLENQYLYKDAVLDVISEIEKAMTICRRKGKERRGH
jgi:hypothetical protein